MTRHSPATRLGEYISLVLPDAHGHQQKAITDFVLAVMMVQSCCQATLARFFDNFEAASLRLFRLLKIVCASRWIGRRKTRSICWSPP